MKRAQTRLSVVLLLVVVGLVVSTPLAIAGGHTWRIKEVFTDASAQIQFIEAIECCGGNGETATAGHFITSTSNSVELTSNVASPTGFRSLLFGTAAYDALPNSPTPDYIIPPDFFSLLGDTIGYSGLDSWVIEAWQIPTDGINSLTVTNHSTHEFSTGVNSPRNYANQTGSVDVSPAPPPGVPDRGATPVTAAKLNATGSSLSVSWDTTTCSDSYDHHIVYGFRSHLPAAPGGTFGMAGGVCGVGATSPYAWSAVPEAGDGSGLLWWLIMANDAHREGSWGEGSDELERNGPSLCNVFTKDVSNACGH